jgi:hypothetical protein
MVTPFVSGGFKAQDRMTNGAMTNVLDGRWIVARMSHRGKTEAPLSRSGASLPAVLSSV